MFREKNRIIAAMIAVMCMFSMLNGFAADKSVINEDDLYANIFETIIIMPECEKMIRYGRRVNLTETNAGTAYYADGKLVVPLRFLTEIFYGSIDYNDTAETCDVRFDQGTFEFSLGNTEGVINGEDGSFSIAPFLRDDRTYVPLEDFVKTMNMGLFFGKNGIVVISPLNGLNTKYFGDDVCEKIKEILTAPESEERLIYVSTDGSKEGDGSESSPLDSIVSARDLIRELRKNGVHEKYKVLISGGTYEIKEAIVFEKQDSGTISNPVEYTAVPGEEVYIEAGYSVDTWEKFDENIYKAVLPEEREDLFRVVEDGVGAFKAHWPNDDYATLIGDNIKTSQSFLYDDIPQINHRVSDLQVGVWEGGSSGAWMWRYDYRKVQNLDTVNKRITLNDCLRGGLPAYILGTGTHYYLLNALEFIDSPGEVYYDTVEKCVYYWPYNADKLNDVVIPREINVFEFQGESMEKPVRNININGIKVNGTDPILSYQGNEMLEGKSVGNAIWISNGCGVEITNCYFKNIGAKVLNSTLNSSANTLRGCYCVNIGDNIYAANDLDSTSYEGKKYGYVERGLKSNFTRIENNYIENSGDIQYSTSAIQIPYGQFQYLHISNNNIKNIRRCGISSSGNCLTGSVIEYNTLEHCMYGSQDGSALYLTSPGGGTARNNIIHDTDSKYGVMTALYIDDESTNIKVYNNLYYDMSLNIPPTEGLLAVSVKSSLNEVYNNVLCNLNTATGIRFNRQTWDILENNTVRNNVLYNCYSRVENEFTAYSSVEWKPDLLKEFDSNVIYNDIEAYKLEIPGVSDIQGIKNAFDGDWLQKDVIGIKPSFMDEKKNDWRMKYDSIAYSNGFKDIDYSNVGLKKDFWYKDKNDTEVGKLFVKRSNDFTDKSSILLSSGEYAKLDVFGRTKLMEIPVDLELEFVSYSSDDPNVATVVDGWVHALAPGKARITVTYNDGVSSCDTDIYIFVDDFAIDRYVVFGEDGEEVTRSVEAGSTAGTTPFIYAVSKLGRIMEVNNKKSSFEAVDNKIAEVNKNGRISGVNPGQTEVVLSSNVEGSTASPCRIKVKVVENFYDRIKVDLISNNMYVGEKVEAGVLGVCRKNGQLKNITPKFISEDESIVKIVEFEGKQCLEAVGAGITYVKAVYDEIDENVLSDRIQIYVTETKNKFLYGYRFRDIGDIDQAGGIKDITDNSFKFFTSGVDVYSSNDKFSYLYKEESGDSEIIATINSYKDLGDISTSMGPMFRIDDSTGSYTVHFRIRGDGNVLLVWRSADKPTCTNINTGNYGFPVSLKLVRTGDTFTGCILENGKWVEKASAEVAMPDKVLAGIAGFSHIKNVETEFDISDFAVNNSNGGTDNE